jgi:hypothetical protein
MHTRLSFFFPSFFSFHVGIVSKATFLFWDGFGVLVFHVHASGAVFLFFFWSYSLLFFFILVYSILLHLKFHHKEAINQARIKTFKLKCLILLCHVFEKEAIYRGILLSLDIKQSCRSKECQCEKYKLCVVPIVWSFMVVMIHLHALE